MATLSPAASLSSTHAAEALLRRARRLSHNANSSIDRSSSPRTTTAPPTAFAEGEELLTSSSSPVPSLSTPTSTTLPSPSLSPASCLLSIEDLHQKHRESFNGIVREHSRKRSSAQRHSSASTASTSSSTSTCPTKNTSPSPLSDPSSTSTTASSPVTMVITSSSSCVSSQEQQIGLGIRSEGDEGDQVRLQDQGQGQGAGSSVASSTNGVSVNTTATTTTDSAQTSTPSSPSQLCPTTISQTNTATTTTTDPSMTRRSLTIVTRPRALTLESIRELRESDHPHSPTATSTSSTTLAPMDHHHRKHRSELGNNATLGLVRGVMEALRDNEQQEKQQQHARARSTPGWALTLPEPNAPTPTSTTAFPQAQARRDLGLDVVDRMKDQVPVENNNKATTPASLLLSPASLPEQHQNPVSPDPAGPGLLATPTSTPIHGTHPMAHYLQATPHGPSISPFTSTMPDGIDAALSGLAPPPPPPPPKSVLDRAFTASSSSPPTSSPLRRSSMTPSSSGGINSDESKGSLLSSSPPSPAQAQNPALAAVTASTKGSRRSSKLFGKLVPKFLQTSFHPNSGPVAGGSSSPRSAVPVSPSPLSSVARPTRSASFTAGTGSEIGAAVVAAGAASGSAGFGSGNKGPLPQLPELPDLSTSVLSSSEDWLGLNGGASHNSKENKDNNKAPSPVLSASPITMESDRPSVVSASTAQFNMSIVAVEESVEGSIHSTDSAFDRRSFNSLQEHDRPLSTMPQEDLYFQKQGHHHSQLQYQYNYHYNDDDEHNKENDEDHLAESPYIIDENCDDNFFLNSVLRKKNSTTSTSNSNNGHSTASSPRPQPPPLLSTGSWNHGATPSLSATSSSSHSQASSMAPSPTSPYPSSSMYTSIPTPVSTTTATPLPLSYRSSYSSNGSTIGGNATTTQMIQSGLDEKRSRLRDAVGEWRRSANASLNSNESTSPPVSTSYSGFAL